MIWGGGGRAEIREWAKQIPETKRTASQTLLWLPVAAHHLWPSLAGDRRLISICSLAQNSSVTCLLPSLSLAVDTATPQKKVYLILQALAHSHEKILQGYYKITPPTHQPIRPLFHPHSGHHGYRVPHPHCSPAHTAGNHHPTRPRTVSAFLSR